MAKKAKLRLRGKDRVSGNQATWLALAAYVNAEPTSPKFEELAYTAVTRCMLGRVEDFWDAFLNSSPSPFEGRDLREEFREQSVRHHAPVRHLLAWLANRRGNFEKEESAIRYLGEHAHCVGFRLDIIGADLEELEKQEGSHNPEVPLFAYRETYRHVVDPICRFVLDQHAHWDYWEADLGTLFPLRLCKRVACGKLFVPKRHRALYCSDTCRARDHQKTPEKMRAYMRDHRRRVKALAEGKKRRVKRQSKRQPQKAGEK